MAILNASLAVLCLHLTILGALPAMLTAQGPPPPPQLPPITKATTRTLSRIVINVAMIAFFIIVLMCLYVLCTGGSGSSGAAERQQGSVRLRRRRRDLDTVALTALAIVPYAEIKKHRSGGGGELECAVCLTAFEDGEKLRLLPQCSHAFHPDCIDPWLEVHVTCPLCRANLEKPAPAVVAPPLPETTPEAVAVQVDEEEEAVELERLRCARRASGGKAAAVAHDGALADAVSNYDGDGRGRRRPREVHGAATAARAGRGCSSQCGCGTQPASWSARAAWGAPCAREGGGGGWSWHGARRRLRPS